MTPDQASPALDFDRLLKLRLVVARVGEMDLARHRCQVRRFRRFCSAIIVKGARSLCERLLKPIGCLRELNILRSSFGACSRPPADYIRGLPKDAAEHTCPLAPTFDSNRRNEL